MYLYETWNILYMQSTGEQKVRRFLSLLLPGKLSGRMLLLIRRRRRRFNSCRRPKTASRPSEQAEKLVCTFKLLPSSSSMLTITPTNALGPTWFDGINGSGPDLLHINDRPHATDPGAILMPPTNHQPKTWLLPRSLQLPIPSFRDGLVLSSSLVLPSPWPRLPYSFENLSHTFLRDVKLSTADIASTSHRQRPHRLRSVAHAGELACALIGISRRHPPCRRPKLHTSGHNSAPSGLAPSLRPPSLSCPGLDS